MHFLVLQTCFGILCNTIIDHITYEVLSSFYEVTVHFTATHSKNKNERYSKLKEWRVKCNLFKHVWIEVCMTANGEGGNEG